MNQTKRNLMMASMALLLALPAFGWQGGPRRMMGGPGGPGGPGGREGHQLNFLAGYLSLTDSQKEQAKAIFDAAAAQAETLSGSMESARTALDAAIKAGAPDSEIDRLSAAVGAVTGQLTAVQAKARVKFRAILTPEQKTKLDELEGRRGRRGPAQQ